MPAPPATASSSPPDARRAAARTRDAIRAAYGRAGLDAGAAGDVRVEVPEPEACVPAAGLARALAEAAERPAALLAPGGGWAGSPFPAESPYVCLLYTSRCV